MATIQTADQAIDALGGTSRVASLFGIDARVVSNWRHRGLPPQTYDVMGRLLHGQSHRFNPALFSQYPQMPPKPVAGRKRGRPRAVDTGVTA